MGFLSVHKYKIGAAAVAGAGTVAVGVGAPHLMSSDSKRPEKKVVPEPVKKPEEQPVEEPPNQQIEEPVLLAEQPQRQPEEDKGPEPKETTSQKVQVLKVRKTELQSNVEQKIGEYKGILNGSNTMTQKAKNLTRCLDYDGDLKREQTKFADAVGLVKDDYQEYEGIKKKVDGDLKDRESRADKDKTNEENYESFKTLLEQIEGEYKEVDERGTGDRLQNLMNTFGPRVEEVLRTCVKRVGRGK